MADTNPWDSDPILSSDNQQASAADAPWQNDPIYDPNAKHGGFLAAAEYGAEHAAHGVGNTLSKVGITKGVGDWIKNKADASIDPSYDPASSHFSWSDPSSYSYAPRAAVEGLAGGATSIAGGALGGAMTGGPVGAVYVDMSVLNGRTASSSLIVCSSNRVMNTEELGLITRIFFDFILMLGSV